MLMELNERVEHNIPAEKEKQPHLQMPAFSPFPMQPASMMTQQSAALFSSWLAQNPSFLANAAVAAGGRLPMPMPVMPAQHPAMMVLPSGMIPSQILKVYTIPTAEGLQLVVQNATEPSELVKLQQPAAPTTAAVSVIRNDRDAAPSPSSSGAVDRRLSGSNNSGIPLKKRRHIEYDDDSLEAAQRRESADSVATAATTLGDTASQVSSTNNTDISDGEDSQTADQPLPRKLPNIQAVAPTMSGSKRTYQHQPTLPEEVLKNMSAEDIKRERNRLAADRCRKKKLAKIDQLTKEVNQMERHRRQVLYQLDSLRHAALAARDAVRNHRAAGCTIPDESGALSRLIAEAESLDNFVKSQL